MTEDQDTRIVYESTVELLIQHLPELRDALDSELKWWCDERPGPHVIYGDVLNPYIEGLLQRGDDTALRRVFEFLELLARSEDLRVQELVAVTVCERLGANAVQLQRARGYMGSATLKHCDDVEAFWNK